MVAIRVLTDIEIVNMLKHKLRDSSLRILKNNYPFVKKESHKRSFKKTGHKLEQKL